MTQTFDLHSSANFSIFLKRFSTIEKSLLMELTSDGKLIGKTHTPDKAVVKISSINLKEIFENQNAEPTKIGIFSVENITSTFKYIGDKGAKVQIISENVSDENTATELKINNKTLRFTFPGASPSLFKYIDAELATKLVDTKDAIQNFRLDKEMLSKLSSLCGIDSDKELLTFKGSNGKITVSGKTFEQELEIEGTKDFKISVYKNHFGFIDKEDSEFFILSSKLIIKSLESETFIVIGKVE